MARLSERKNIIRNAIDVLGKPGSVKWRIFEKVNGKLNAPKIAQSLSLQPTNVTNDLRVLDDSGLIRAVGKIGKSVIYDKIPELKHVNLKSHVKIAKTGKVITPIKVELRPKIPTDIPFLTSDDISNLRRMPEAYAILYAFENSVRKFIQKVGQDHYSNSWWNNLNISGGIQKTLQIRRNEEDENRWHEKRNAHEIYYTDFKDLESIIINNWKIFKNFFPKKDGQFFVKRVLKTVVPGRNIIAHSNPLHPREVRRLIENYTDWKNQMKGTS